MGQLKFTQNGVLQVFYSEEYRTSNHDDEHQILIKKLKQVTTLQVGVLRSFSKTQVLPAN